MLHVNVHRYDRGMKATNTGTGGDVEQKRSPSPPITWLNELDDTSATQT